MKTPTNPLAPSRRAIVGAAAMLPVMAMTAKAKAEQKTSPCARLYREMAAAYQAARDYSDKLDEDLDEIERQTPKISEQSEEIGKMLGATVSMTAEFKAPDCGWKLSIPHEEYEALQTAMLRKCVQKWYPNGDPQSLIETARRDIADHDTTLAALQSKYKVDERSAEWQRLHAVVYGVADQLAAEPAQSFEDIAWKARAFLADMDGEYDPLGEAILSDVRRLTGAG